MVVLEQKDLRFYADGRKPVIEVPKKFFSAKQGRAFQTILSGLKVARYGRKIIRFLTLTTSALCYESIGFGNGSINADFQKLRKRILRRSPYKLYKEGYISKKKMMANYSRGEWFKNFDFDYFKVETNEGNGVLHILYRGSYLPYNFLVDNWQDIHLSWDLNIKMIHLDNCKSASCYVVSQYVGGQEGSSYVRSSQSWSWLWRGFKSEWYSLRHWYKDKCIELWEDRLRGFALDTFYPQYSMDDFG